MHLETLEVFHLKKKSLPRDFELPRIADAFFFESCQRYVWITTTEFANSFRKKIEAAEQFRGSNAYYFLMNVSTGLESEIVGETDIFGQLKDAWSQCTGLPDSLIASLKVWMPKLFEDTKELRSRYLQNLGGVSYGSLVRKLVLRGSGPVLVIGAGKLAQSVVPYLLSNCEIWIANRDSNKLETFYEQLSQETGAKVKKIESAKLDEALANAAQVLICIPSGETEAGLARDRKWIHVRRHVGGVIHLGVMREQAGDWQGVAQFRCLDDLFELQKSLGDFRSIQIQQAKKACIERAKLRALGPSISLPHGWEDLAIFAT